MEFTVTVGLCVKNSAATIDKTLDSIMRQSFPKDLTKIIVVDGFSKDNTLEIIRSKLVDTNLEYEIYREKEGLGLARQIVLDKSDSRYILWVDGDIVLSDEYLSTLCKFMEENPNVGIVRGKCGIAGERSVVATLEDVNFAIVDHEYGSKPSGKLPGTGGSVYRVEALRKIKGFDLRIKGAGEDIDAAYRIRESGWTVIYSVDSLYYEDRPENWSGLLCKYLWYGYGLHYVVHKDRKVLTLYRMSPFAGIAAGLIHSKAAYKLIRRRKVFLLPLHNFLKMTAWLAGFTKSHFDDYGHR